MKNFIQKTKKFFKYFNVIHSDEQNQLMVYETTKLTYEQMKQKNRAKKPLARMIFLIKIF